VSWWVEGRPWNCADPVAPVARQAELACDAAGGRCRVARTRDEADRIAALTCGADGSAWRLDAEDRTGRVVWSVVLTGDVEGRARKAGLWIARAEEGGPPGEDQAAAADAPPAPPSAAAAPNGEAATNAPSPDAAPARVEEAAPSPAPAPHTRPYRRIWIGAEGSIDLLAVPGTTDVCKQNAANTGPATPGNPYSCVDPGTNAPFPGTDGTTNALILSHGDLVQSGLAFSSPRIAVSLDYAVSPNLLVGGRIGSAFESNPTSKSVLHGTHLEARATYLFGEDAIVKTFAPMAFAGIGIGYFDAHVDVPVFLNSTGSGVPVERPESAWISAGPLFVEAGGGLRVLLTDTIAASLAVRFEAFGGSGVALTGAAPEAGLQLGF
jgi:hypothetical protein